MIGKIKRWLCRNYPFYMPRKWVKQTFDYDMHRKGVDPNEYRKDFMDRLNDKMNNK